MQWETRFFQAKWLRTAPEYEKRIKRETKLYERMISSVLLLFADMDEAKAKQIMKLDFFLIMLRNKWM